MKTKVILILIIALSNSLLFSQEKVADKYFRDYAYIKAAQLYENAVKKGNDSEHVLTRLGDCYYNNSNSEKAALWYGKAVEKYKDINPEYIYKYIQTLRSTGDYKTANQWMVTFKELQGSDKYVDDFEIMKLDKYEELSSTQGIYVDFTPLENNTEYSEFGGYVHDGKYYFASTKIAEGAKKSKLYKWNEEPYLDIYVADISEDGVVDISNAKSISNEINTDFHEATVAITNNGQTIYFTRDNLNKRNKLSYDGEGTSHLKIYSAVRNESGKDWVDVTELPFNDKLYSSGHPALSVDNKTLYFVSDREGGLGQTDIYSVEIKSDNTYGEPVNLGDKINSPGREMFPFVAKDSTFYFSSDGHINLGLLDVFKSNIIKDKQAAPENLGAPFNSRFDDFAFFIDSEKETGFISSNRAQGSGSDDIYKFEVYQCQQIIKGVVKEKVSLIPISLASVKLLDEKGKVIQEITSNELGEFKFDVDCEKKYTIVGSKVDFRDDIKQVSTSNVTGKEQIQDLILTPLIIENEIVINPIFFDFDKSKIRDDAAYELENIVTIMNNHPKMIIKIEAHTDSRGRDAYNEKLSDRRAKSTRDYIISRGIATERLESAIGYGEKQLLNECSNGVKCSEAKHQENRRSKFIIINKD